MADPIKEQIAAAAVTALEGIKKSQGYYTDAGKRVLRRREHIQEVDGSSMPCLYLFSGTEDPPSEALGGGCLYSKAELVVTGYTEAGDDLDEQVIKLETDIKVAMLSNRQWDSLAEKTELLGSTTDYSEFAPWGRGIVVVSVDVSYKWTLTVP